MRAVAATAPGSIQIVDIPAPDCREYECLLRTEATGFCSSTDMKLIEGDLHNIDITYPFILGHEGVGRIVSVGAKVRNASVGQRFMFSTTRIADGTEYKSMWGGMCEYAVMKDAQAMVDDGIDPHKAGRGLVGFIPEEISSADATSVLTVAENYSALKNFSLSEGMNVLIYGDGSVGFGLARLARLLGAGFIVSAGHHEERLARIRPIADLCINTTVADLQNTVGTVGFDLVIDAVGRSSIIKEGAQLLKPGGRVGAYGVLHRKDAAINLLDLPNHTLLHMLNFPYGEFDVHDEMIDLALEGKVDLSEYYTHTLPVEACAEAMEMVKSREALKVVLEFC